MVQPAHRRVRRCRDQLSGLELWPVWIWVPDVHSAAFKAEARRQSRAVAEADRRDDTQGFLDAIQDLGEPT